MKDGEVGMDKDARNLTYIYDTHNDLNTDIYNPHNDLNIDRHYNPHNDLNTDSEV